MKYIAYLSTGEILETMNFKTIYKAALFRLHDEGTGAVIFCRKNGNALIAALWRGFHKDFIFRGNEIADRKYLLKTPYMEDKYGEYCWNMAGLEA